MGVRIREATELDLERLVELHTFAFPDSRGHDARIRNFRSKPLGGLPRLRVAVDPAQADRIVGHAFLLDLQVFIAGRPVRTGGIATVGVEPAYRGRGVASEILAALHAEAAREHMPLTMLYAFRQGFYERAGYSPVTPFQRLDVSPSSLPVSFASPDVRVRSAAAGDREVICRAYERACAQSTGFVARPTARWDELLADERLAFALAVDGAGAVLGVVAYHLLQAESHAKIVLHVEELYATDAVARRALLHHLRQLKDQVATIQLSLGMDDPLACALVDPDATTHGNAIVEHPLGQVCGGPLVRMSSLSELLLARGYQDDGELVLATSGVQSSCVRLVVTSGRAEVAPADPATADVTLSDRAASVLAGGLRVRDAARLGFARASSPDALRRADSLLATPAFLSYDGF